MSRILAKDVPCPHCGHVQRRDVLYSLNGARTPHLRQAVLDGRFGRVLCEGCGETFALAHPFLYVDFERSQWIGVFLPSQEASWATWENEVYRVRDLAFGPDAPTLAQALGWDMRPRAVFGIAALREKLLAEQAGLSDIILEALKLDLLMADGFARFTQDGGRLRLVAVDDTSLSFEWIAGFEAEDPATWHLEVGRERYVGIAYNPMHYRKLLDALCEGPYVDLGRTLAPSVPPSEQPTSMIEP